MQPSILTIATLTLALLQAAEPGKLTLSEANAMIFRDGNTGNLSARVFRIWTSTTTGLTVTF
ncbi:hypothetical protein AbraCBS73388_001607, partial [Aspergillus brasiliensis]